MPRESSARLSSQSAIPTSAATYSRNVAFTVNSVRMATPPIRRPTPIATGRLRPARLGLRSAAGAAGPGFGSSPGPGPSAPGPCSLGPCCSGLSRSGRLCSGLPELALSGSRRKLYLEKLGFLVPKQLVHLRHVAVRELIELALRAPAVILARLTVLDELVD